MSGLALRNDLQPVERARLSELEAVVERGLQTFVEVGNALMEIRDGRLYREMHPTFEDYCQQRWSKGRRWAYQMIDAAGVCAIAHTADLPAPANEAQARELVPLLREQEAAMVEVWRELRIEYGERITADRVRGVVQRRLERERREDESALAIEQRLADMAAAPSVGERYKLIHGDLAAVELEPDSIDVIITDPPYPAEYLPLYGDLGRLAAKVLRPGGSCIAMAGQEHLLDAGALLRDHLSYVWTLGYGLPGRYSRIWSKRIWVGWKPVLWFAKGQPHNTRWIHDRLLSPGRDKQFHSWGQSVGGMEQLVDRFSNPGETILDPFVGGGSTAVAALQLGRRFVGVDIDERAISMTRTRIAELGDSAEAQVT